MARSDSFARFSSFLRSGLFRGMITYSLDSQIAAALHAGSKLAGVRRTKVSSIRGKQRANNGLAVFEMACRDLYGLMGSKINFLARMDTTKSICLDLGILSIQYERIMCRSVQNSWLSLQWKPTSYSSSQSSPLLHSAGTS